MKWYRQKTTWTGIAGIVAAVAGWAIGEIEMSAALAAIIAALSVIFMRQGVAKATTPFLLLVFCGLMMTAGCKALEGVPDNVLDKSPDANVAALRGGEANATTEDASTPIAGGVAWGASSVNSKSVMAQNKPTSTNSGAGHLATGLNIAGMNFETALTEMKTDPVLKSYAQEIAYLITVMTSGEPVPEGTAERMDAVRIAYAQYKTELMEGMKGMSGDFSALANLTVVNWIWSDVGAENRAPSDAEARMLQKMLPDVIYAAEGVEGIQDQGSGE